VRLNVQFLLLVGVHVIDFLELRDFDC